jgi:drug/metabolite transporter (DMT)-like permease
MSASSLIWSLIISSIGLGYFLYGKKATNIIALISGLILMIYPYFVQNILVSIVLGVALIIAPFIIK